MTIQLHILLLCIPWQENTNDFQTMAPKKLHMLLWQYRQCYYNLHLPNMQHISNALKIIKMYKTDISLTHVLHKHYKRYQFCSGTAQ
eukprot:m.42682 g.42682  ORF g.42682 m.42682 type:complete len:87 (-) comp9900_c0_seq1:27-287(-)